MNDGSLGNFLQIQGYLASTRWFPCWFQFSPFLRIQNRNLRTCFSFLAIVKCVSFEVDGGQRLGCLSQRKKSTAAGACDMSMVVKKAKKFLGSTVGADVGLPVAADSGVPVWIAPNKLFTRRFLVNI